jgi:hypothetical protein
MKIEIGASPTPYQRLFHADPALKHGMSAPLSASTARSANSRSAVW